MTPARKPRAGTARRPQDGQPPSVERPAPARWNLAAMMSARGLNQLALRRALSADAGHSLSESQTSRLARGQLSSVPLSLLSALCRVLKCEPNDLLVVDRPSVPNPKPLTRELREHGKRMRATGAMPEEPTISALPAMDEAERSRVVGPRVFALPSHLLARKDVPK